MARPPIPYDVAVRVYFRDGWLCSHCRRPTVFHLALKLLAERVTQALPHAHLAYWDERWRRDQSPLLDQLAASIDHVDAFSKGGEHGEANFATICVKCNLRKGTRTREEHAANGLVSLRASAFRESSPDGGMAYATVLGAVYLWVRLPLRALRDGRGMVNAADLKS